MKLREYTHRSFNSKSGFEEMTKFKAELRYDENILKRVLKHIEGTIEVIKGEEI